MIKHRFTAILALLCSGGLSVYATDAIYVNHGYVFDAPQIDAAAFFNDGYIDLVTELPFSTLNTVNFTNRGFMVNAPGWQIDHSSAAGRQPLNNFVNEGTMEGEDFGGFTVVTGNNGQNQVISASTPVSYILLSATNVTSTGLLNVGSGGLIKIEAQNANLSRSGVRSGGSLFGSTGLGGGGSDFVFNNGTNFLPAPGILDVYWGVGTNQALAAGRGQPLVLDTFRMDVPFPRGPSHEVQNTLLSTNFFFTSQVPFFQPTPNRYSGFVFTNMVGGSNAIIQVVLIATNLNNGSVQSSVRWAPGANGARIPVARIAAPAYDTALNVFVTNEVYVSDDIMTRSNVFISLNGNALTGRPVNYRVSQSPLPEWFNGTNSNTFFNYNNHIWNFQWASSTVTNGYTAYSFTVDRGTTNSFAGLINGIPTRGFSLGNPFAPAFNDPTNQAGRVEIHAEHLDLSRTRIRAQNYARVESPDVTTDTNTIMDSPYLSLNIANPNGAMNLAGSIPSSVDRISGQIYMWTGVWTNTQTVLAVNNGTVTSNTFNISQQVWIVDNEHITKSVSVGVTEASLKATNITIGDPMEIMRGLRLEGENITINNNLDLLQDLVDLGPTNFAGTVNLTNNGTIFNLGRVTLGVGAGDPLSVFENNGRWTSYTAEWDVDQLVNDGILFTVNGPLTLTASKANLRSGSVLSNFDIHFNFGDLLAGYSTVSAGYIYAPSGIPILLPGRLFINVANSVDDGGVGGGNIWTVTDGFELPTKPATGDFLGTRLYSYGFQFHESTHKWAGEDRGLNVSGFTDNAAVDTLVLDGGFLSTFTFEPAGGNNALYVETLELRNYATNVLNALNIKPGMKIYFGQAKFNDTVIPSSQLDGLFADADAPGGRLRQLTPPAPDTVTLTLASGQTFTVARSLLTSTVVDSDGDGVVNAYDSSPFDPVKLDVQFVEGENAKAVVSWNAAPRTEYDLQYKDDVTQQQWQTLTNFVTYSDNRRINIEDPNGNNGHRYYRLNYTP